MNQITAVYGVCAVLYSAALTLIDSPLKNLLL